MATKLLRWFVIFVVTSLSTTVHSTLYQIKQYSSMGYKENDLRPLLVLSEPRAGCYNNWPRCSKKPPLSTPLWSWIYESCIEVLFGPLCSYSFPLGIIVTVEYVLSTRGNTMILAGVITSHCEPKAGKAAVLKRSYQAIVRYVTYQFIHDVQKVLF